MVFVLFSIPGQLGLALVFVGPASLYAALQIPWYVLSIAVQLVALGVLGVVAFEVELHASRRPSLYRDFLAMAVAFVLAIAVAAGSELQRSYTQALLLGGGLPGALKEMSSVVKTWRDSPALVLVDGAMLGGACAMLVFARLRGWHVLLQTLAVVFAAAAGKFLWCTEHGWTLVGSQPEWWTVELGLVAGLFPIIARVADSLARRRGAEVSEG